MKRIIAAVILLSYVVVVVAQTPDDWESLLNQVVGIDEAEDADWADNYETLNYLAEHPMDINTASTDDLLRLPFLTASQVEDIDAYRYRHGALRSLGELAMIESIDAPLRKLMSCFLYVDKNTEEKDFPSIGNILKYGRHELLATGQIPFYKRKGDENGYLGYQYRHWLRYDFRRGEWLRAGIVASQDAGEPFFAQRNKAGYDYYSAYLMIRHLGRVKALAVGRYRMKLGMGLAVNNSLSFGKLAMLASLNRQQPIISAHSSRSEGNYLQGAAATVTAMKGLDITAFASYRNRDATLNDDGSIATLLTTGYHRTASEMERKGNTHQTAFGGNINYSSHGFHAGLTAVQTSLNRTLNPDTRQIYRAHYPSGDSFWNASIDYGYISRRLSIGGETATGGSGGVATINTISYEVVPSLRLTALQRFYSYKYYSLFSRSFGDASSVQNESGVYLSATWRPLAWLSLMAYTDYAYHPWAVYQADKESRAWDNLASATMRFGKVTANVRYRYRTRERNGDEEGQLIWRQEHRARAQVDYDGGAFTTRSQIDVATCEYKASSFGWMFSQRLSYACRWLRASLMAGYFHTDDYDSRVYTYEQGMLYEFSFPVFYGEGIRYALSLRSDISAHLMLQAKVGVTDYFDRDHISSGLQQIDRSSKADMWLQLKWRF
ncbi:MAG: helix-hairpin-helix domain-containing protein [Prevotella sp.]|nr:helix-hairpin-helix domain-containing protein [Prevotella sp.]